MKFIAIVLLLSAPALAQYPPAQQAGAQPYHRAVVRVDAGQGWGSGTLIATDGKTHGLVLTCAHVIGQGAPYNVQFPGVSYNLKPYVVAKHEGLDVAALWVWTPPGVEPIPLSDYVPTQGSAVELCGYGGGRWGVTRTKVRGRAQHRFAIKTDVGIEQISIPGESGGPILTFDSGEPRLAAVNWGGPSAVEYYTRPMRHSQGADSHQIRAWLQQSVASKLPWVLGEIEVSN